MLCNYQLYMQSAQHKMTIAITATSPQLRSRADKLTSA
jgi:hypothetical protein